LVTAKLPAIQKEIASLQNDSALNLNLNNIAVNNNCCNKIDPALEIDYQSSYDEK
jgi:hypothetical protein